MKRVLLLAVVAVCFVATAHASPVTVQVNATVEYNQMAFGAFGAVNPGDNVMVQFQVDSENFVDSGSFPVRGYVIEPASFVLVMGSVSAGLQDPFPAGQTPYFVMRDNDPAADGFYLSTGVDFPVPLALDEPGGIDPFFGLRIEVGYIDTILSSLNILDAIGTYDYAGLTSFYTIVADAFAEPIGLEFVSLTITAPLPVESTTWGGLKSLYR